VRNSRRMNRLLDPGSYRQITKWAFDAPLRRRGFLLRNRVPGTNRVSKSELFTAKNRESHRFSGALNRLAIRSKFTTGWFRRSLWYGKRTVRPTRAIRVLMPQGVALPPNPTASSRRGSASTRDSTRWVSFPVPPDENV